MIRQLFEDASVKKYLMMHSSSWKEKILAAKYMELEIFEKCKETEGIWICPLFSSYKEKYYV